MLLTPILVCAANCADIGASDLSALIVQSNRLDHVDFCTRFELRIGKPVAATKLAVEWANALHAFETFDQCYQGGRFRSTRRSFSTTDGEAQLRYEQTNAWSDGTWYHMVADDKGMTLSGQAHPTDMYAKAFAFNICAGRLPSFDTLATLVAQGMPLAQSRVDGVLMYRFAARDVPATFCQHVIEATWEPSFRVLSHTIEFSGANDSAPEPFAAGVYHRQIFRVVEWQRFGDVDIPFVAIVDTCGGPGSPPIDSDPVTCRAEYRRTMIERFHVALADSHFRLPFSNRLYVTDTRCNASYRVGDNWITVDGINYLLASTVQGDVNAELPQLLAAAKPTTRLPGQSTQQAVTNVRDEKRVLTWHHASIAALLACGIGMLLWRLRKK